jgi:hypothetical protein
VGEADTGVRVGDRVGAGGGPDAVQCALPSDVSGAASSPVAHAHQTSAAGGVPCSVQTDGLPNQRGLERAQSQRRTHAN